MQTRDMTDAQKLQTMANYANVLLSHARMNQGEFMSLINSNTKRTLIGAKLICHAFCAKAEILPALAH